MFEWDEAKRQATIKARGLDFTNARRIFDGRPVLTMASNTPHESRYSSVALLEDGKFYAVIWTWRNELRRIISFRRARTNEARAYRQIFGQ
jgi:uncharacterized DUF497 family protein